MKTIEIKKNSLLHREEIVTEIENVSTPSKADVAKIISEEMKKPEENIVIEKIKSEFGTKKAIITAKVYDSLDSKNKFEVVPRKVRKKQAKEAADASGKK